MSYRAEIQGMRAISIIFVIAFHFGLSFFKGGYIGVDIFFVISGYLITSLIQKDINAGCFLLRNFYKNRIVRLLPNLFAMLVFSYVISYLYLLPYDFRQYTKSLTFSGLYVTNIVFSKQQGYFDISRELKPLLHTWSLSIEEQFYLFFPVLIIIINKYIQYVKYFILFIFMASFLYKIWIIDHQSFESFFYFLGRVWELSLGAIAVFISMSMKDKIKSNEYISTICFLLIIASLIILDENTRYSGVILFIPCLATVGLILCCQNTRVGKFLSHPILFFIGGISYSLYLWHWPIFVAVRNSHHNLSPINEKILLFFATFLISSIAYKYIEQPFRQNKSRFSTQWVLISALCFSISCAAFGEWSYRQDGFKNRFPNWVNVEKNINQFNFEKKSNTKLSRSDCSLIGDVCYSGDKTAKESILILGDSHMRAVYPAFEVAAQRTHYRLANGVTGGCPPLLGIESLDRDKDICDVHFEELKRNLTKLIHTDHFKKVYLIAYWNLYLEGSYRKGSLQHPSHFISDKITRAENARESKTVIKKSLRETVEFFQKNNIEVNVMIDVPILPDFIQELPVGYTQNITEIYQQNKFMKDLATELNIKYINPIDVLCPANHCITFLNDNFLYRDNNHISPAGALLLVDLITNSI